MQQSCFLLKEVYDYWVIVKWRVSLEEITEYLNSVPKNELMNYTLIMGDELEIPSVIY